MLQLGVSYRVEELVPHRGAMCLLDTIDGYGEDWLRAALTVRPREHVRRRSAACRAGWASNTWRRRRRRSAASSRSSAGNRPRSGC